MYITKNLKGKLHFITYKIVKVMVKKRCRVRIGRYFQKWTLKYGMISRN